MPRQVLLPEMDEKFAYFLGLLLGDGCLGIIEKPVIYLVGDLVDEYDYYVRIVVPLISKLFGISVNLHPKKMEQAIQIAFYSRDLLEHLQTRIGFPGRGMTKLIPPPIRDAVPRIKAAFLRGLFDADGSLIFSLKSYGSYCYPTVEIKSVDRALVDSVSKMLSELGFRACIRKSAESWVVSMNGETQLGLWMKIVGSSNVKHLSKYMVWKANGSCPPYTRTPERLTALRLNPGTFYSELFSRTGLNALPG